MKILTIICYLFLSVNAFAQNTDASNLATQDVGAGKKTPLYVVDGKIDTSGREVNRADILNVVIVSNAKAVSLYGKQGEHGAIVIITKKYAVAEYQKKFSAFAKKYKGYMELKHDDNNLMYVLNNVIMDQRRKSSIQALYELSPDSIAKVNFKKNSRFKTDATIEITTKKQD